MHMFEEKPGLRSVLKRIILRMDGLEEESEHRLRFCFPIIWYGRRCAALSASLGVHVTSLKERFVAVIQNIFIWFLAPSPVTADYTYQKCYPMQTSKRPCACLYVHKLNHLCCHQGSKVPWILMPRTSSCFRTFGRDWFIKAKVYQYLLCITRGIIWQLQISFRF